MFVSGLCRGVATGSRTLLSATERAGPELRALAGSGWVVVAERDALRKDYAFRDFSRAWAFMSRVALRAEKLGHHPEWSNNFGAVQVCLSTHSAGGLSQLDLRLAKFCDSAAKSLLTS